MQRVHGGAGEEIRGFIRHWLIGGAIFAVTGISPEEWYSKLFEKLEVPGDVELHVSGHIIGPWSTSLTIRVILLVIGVSMIIGSVLRYYRQQHAGTERPVQPPPPPVTVNVNVVNERAAQAFARKPAESPADRPITPPSSGVHTSTSSGATESFDVFLSYAHPDAAVVEALAGKLEDAEKLTVWLDRWVLIPGAHWQQQMARGLESAKTCAVCVGGHTPQGWFREEIEKALNRQVKDTTFRVIPVILPGGNPRYVDEFLALRTWIDFTSGIDDARAFHNLASGIRGLRPGRFLQKQPDEYDEAAAILEQLRFIHNNREIIDSEVRIEFQRKLLNIKIKPDSIG